MTYSKINIIKHYNDFKLILLYLIINFLITFITLYSYNVELIYWMTKGFIDINNQFMYNTPTEIVMIYIKITFWYTILLNLPIIIYLINSYFFKIYKNKLIKIFLTLEIVVLTIFLTIYNIILNYNIPYILNFLTKFERKNSANILIITLETKLNNYLNLIINLTLIIIILIILPFITILITNIINKNIKLEQILKFNRKIIYLIITITFIIFAPPDIILQLIILPSIIILTEIIFYIITLTWIIIKKWRE